MDLLLRCFIPCQGTHGLRHYKLQECKSDFPGTDGKKSSDTGKMSIQWLIAFLAVKVIILTMANKMVLFINGFVSKLFCMHNYSLYLHVMPRFGNYFFLKDDPR